MLRLAVGDSLRVGIIDGPVGTAHLIERTSGSVQLRCAWNSEVPERPAVDLILAVPRPKVLRRLWAQLAALGVGRVMLVNAERVERNYFDTHWLRNDVYRPLLVEGLQQARDTRLPAVSVHRRFRPFIEDQLGALSPRTRRLVADPASATPVAAAVTGGSDLRVTVAIGPEGGWNAFELDLLAAHGFVAVGLGPRTLRTDTACIAVLALVNDALRNGRR